MPRFKRQSAETVLPEGTNMKSHIVGLASAALLIASAVYSYGDPIVITSGRIATDFDGIDTFGLNTSGFTLSMYYVPENVQMPAALTQGSYGGPPVFAFQLGQALDLSAVITGVFRENRPGNPNVAMTLNLEADPVRVTSIPTARPPLEPVIPLQTPFRLTGVGTGDEVLFTGAGMLTAEGVLRTPDRLTLFAPEWTFSSASSSPTPEPASILLLGAGIAGVISLRQRIIR